MAWTQAAAAHFISVEKPPPLLQVVSNNKSFSVGVQSPTEINAPRGHTLSSGQWFCADRNEVQTVRRFCRVNVGKISVCGSCYKRRVSGIWN